MSPNDREAWAQRRAALFDAMAASSPSAVAVLPSAPVFLRNNDVEHEYRQDSDFFYVTGFDEPESVVVLDAKERKTTLFVRPRDRDREVWDGPRAGIGRRQAEVRRRRGVRHRRPRGEAAGSPAEPAPRSLPDRLRPAVRRAPSRRHRPRPGSGAHAASSRRPRSSIRAPSSTRCAFASRPSRSRRCALPPGSPARRTRGRWRARARGCASTRSRRSSSIPSAVTGPSGRRTGASWAPAPTRACSTTARTIGASSRVTCS